MAEYACTSAAGLQELINLFLHGEFKVAQKAAWVVSHVAKINPALMLPYLGDMVALLARSDVHNSVIRNALRVLQYQQIPEDCHAAVLNACFALIESVATPGAIKAFSITTLDNLCSHYPDVAQELRLVLEERWDNETPAFKSRARKILGR